MKTAKAIALIILTLTLALLVILRVSDDSVLKPGLSPAPTEAAATPEPEPLVFETPPVELKAELTAKQLRELDTSALRKLDLTGSTCYEAIKAFKRQHSDIEVLYSILLQGDGDPMLLDPGIETLRLDNASYLPSLIENVAWLSELKALSIETDSADASVVDAFREAAPDCQVDYSLSLLEELYPYDTEELTLTGMDAQKLRGLLPQLQRFSHLTAVNLPGSENDLSLEEAMSISEESDLIRLDYQIDLFGQSVSLDAESIEFENQNIGKEGLEELRSLLPFFKNLRYLKLDDCGIDNESMAALRDDFPDIKVVWRVYFGNYHCLTDTEMIWATGGSVNDSTCDVLKYCTDVKYLDLGHALMTRVDFLKYMPKLEVAILAISWVEDISPIANCPNLEYLEIFSARVSDFSPLAQCTHLQHLNISCQRNANNVPVGPTDISSLYDLPELKRFYCTMSYVPEEQQKEMISRHPDCEFEFRWVDPAEGHWRFKDGLNNNVPENRVERYALLYEQFGYATYQQSGKTWSLYG